MDLNPLGGSTLRHLDGPMPERGRVAQEWIDDPAPRP
jgi:hypothetical protein